MRGKETGLKPGSKYTLPACCCSLHTAGDRGSRLLCTLNLFFWLKRFLNLFFECDRAAFSQHVEWSCGTRVTLEDGHFSFCLEARVGVSASVPVFSTQHSETGLEKSLEMGWCLRILISLLVWAKQSCIRVRGGTAEEQHVRYNGPVSF